MTLDQTNLISALATVLPDPTGDDALTPEQWKILRAIAETVLPSISRAGASNAEAQLSLDESEYDALVDEIKRSVENPPSESIIVDYLREGATSYDAFQRELQRTLSVHVSEESRKGIAFILNSMKYVSLESSFRE